MRSVAAWALVLCTCVCACGAEKWRWPDSAPAVRIDTRVHFIDADGGAGGEQTSSRAKLNSERQYEASADESFNQLAAGRYPVRVETYQDSSSPAYDFRKSSPSQYSDGTLESMPVQCKCVSKLECGLRGETSKACGSGKYLCCYKRPYKKQQNAELFNEVNDERRELLTENEFGGPFPSPPGSLLDGDFGPGHSQEAAVFGNVGSPNRPVLVGPGGPTGLIGPPNHNQGVLTGPGGPTGIIDPAQQKQPILIGPGGPTGLIDSAKNRPILIGPGGPTGIIGPKQQQNQALLVGPEGPTGVIGPAQNRPILVGPGGPTGSIGPQPNKNVLVGPGGPTGVIGPANKDYYLDRGNYDIGSSETAQRGVLVGPGGPTGIFGPVGYGGRPVLVGPGGPTGIIGPSGRGRRPVLVGPGGPTGIIGPPRRPYYGK